MPRNRTHRRDRRRRFICRGCRRVNRRFICRRCRRLRRNNNNRNGDDNHDGDLIFND